MTAESVRRPHDEDNTWVRLRIPLDVSTDTSATARGVLRIDVHGASKSQRSPSTRISTETYVAIGLGAITAGLYIDTEAKSIPKILRSEDVPAEAVTEPSPAETEGITENEKRVALLARKYVHSRLSPEEQARLAIVTERIRTLLPRISVDELENIEKLASRTKELDDYDMEVRKKLESLESK